MYTVGSLFAGIDGLGLAAIWAGFIMKWQTDYDAKRVATLRRNHPATDQLCASIRDIQGRNLAAVDVVCGGPPCQPYSDAGNKRGATDDRHLWPEMYRIIRELDPQPRAVFFENVPGIRNMVLAEILTDLETAGYGQRFVFRIPIAALGAPHIRYRVFVMAYTDQFRRQRTGTGECVHHEKRNGETQEQRGETEFYETVPGMQDRPLGNATGARLSRRESIRENTESQQSAPQRAGNSPARRLPQPRLGRDANGLSYWLDGDPAWPAWRGQPQYDWEPPRTIAPYPGRRARVAAIGNAVSPLHAYPLWFALMAELTKQDQQA